MSSATLEALYGSYAAARAAGDYDAAIGYLTDMIPALGITPDTSQGVGGAGAQSVRWREVDLQEAIAQCRRLKIEARTSSVGPLQASKITYSRPSA